MEYAMVDATIVRVHRITASIKVTDFLSL